MAVQGTWNVLGYNIPDLGFTEGLGIGSGTNWQNPQIPFSSTAQDINQAKYAQQQYYQQGGPTLQASRIPTYSTPAPSGGGGGQVLGGQAPQQSADSPIRELEKIGWENMNPDQRSRYLAMIGQQQQQSEAERRQAEEAQLNEIYSPLFGTLESQKQQYESQLPGYQQQVTGEFERGLEDVTGQEAESQRQLAKQGTSVQESEANALQKARQVYNELSQRYGALFGSRTSAGPFAMEILGRETQKQFGDVGKLATQGMQAVSDEKNRLTTWVNTQKNEWGRKKNEAMNNLTISFNNAIQQINAQRGQLESDKASRRYDILAQARERASQIEAADVAFNRQLQLFQAERGSQMQSATQNLGVGNVPGAYTEQLGQAYNPSVANAATPITQTPYNYLGNYTEEYDPITGQRRRVPQYSLGQAR